MSHIKDRLIQLKNEVENTGNGAYFSKNNISKIVELLLTDLEQDEKENGWIPVSERLPKEDGRYLVTFKYGIKVCMVGYGSCKRTVLGCPIGHNTFYHVVFDPPHLIQGGDNAWMVKKYGKLNKDTWKRMLHDGFSECMRVLKPYGTLIFKWNETQIPVKDVITAIGAEPLYGNRSGKQGKTHWMAFIKVDENDG